MGDVVSSHLDEGRREMITARTREVMKEFGDVYEQQYAVALFNSVRFEIEGGGGKQSQLLHRKDPLAGRSIFSGNLFQYLEENRKWRNRFVSVPNSYNIDLFESKTAHERGLHPKVTINCAGYKALASMEEYLELINNSLPGIKAKVGNNPFIKCATQFPLILWHPYARHHYFCVMTEKEHKKWHAVLQDCVRHSNNAGLSEDCTVQTPAFTDSVRLHRQAKGHYGTWDMMCGEPPQILANLVMETLHPELRNVIGPRLKGKLQQRQRNWMLISDAVYKQVLSQTTGQYEALTEACEAQKAPLDARLRTDMDQIITSKEHVSSKIRALVLPKAEQLLHSSVQPYISSILEALMEPTSRGFSEVRDVFFRELVEISKNSINGGGKEKLGEHMERLSMLAFHPVKMQSCYEKVEELNLEGLQQRFDVSNPSVFISRAQILMREQMDNAVYTFEQLLNQSLEAQGEENMCKTIQRCQDRVLKKYDYDSSTVRKKFFREALLQIIIPYMLQQLSPSCSPELPRFKELIFEDFSRFLLVENMFEEVVLQSVTKDIMMGEGQETPRFINCRHGDGSSTLTRVLPSLTLVFFFPAVKEAAVQRRHNLYRDSIILTNSDPNLHLLGETPGVDWASKFGGDEADGSVEVEERGSGRRRKQVVSMIQLDGVPLPYESCLEVPGVELIPEEDPEVCKEEDGDDEEEEELGQHENPKSPDSVNEIRDLINPVVEVVLPVVVEEKQSDETNGPEETSGTIVMDDGLQEEVTHVTTVVEDRPRKSVRDKSSPQSILKELVGGKKQEADKEEAAIKNAIEEIEIAVQEDDGERIAEASTVESDRDSSPPPVPDSRSREDSGFQSPTNEGLDEGEPQPITNGLNGEDKVIDPAEVEVIVA
ncbi:protein Niban 2a isoform X1 [Stegastes partitus]|uniref:Protein Niban 2a isoform X1 n=1 Tax=Stegastes partitus TaxID=144197 RepID=A0A9Y4K863_9TELE|nr:PREDICTED: niban-like protein 1 isoform X1 [Stegastes partitus]